jgi:hypothetical protein
MGHTSPHFLGAMLSAMLILAAPAFVLCAGVSLLAYRKRGEDAEPPHGPAPMTDDDTWAQDGDG